VSRTIFSRKSLTFTLLAVMFVALAVPAITYALPRYTEATGQPCSTCHVNPAGGGALTPLGQRFAAIPNHSTDPVAAFQQAQQPAQATPAPAQPAPAPAQTTPGPAQPTPAPGALPTTGGVPFVLLVMGASALAAAGFGLRRLSR
jgi:hypothetical protein